MDAGQNHRHSLSLSDNKNNSKELVEQLGLLSGLEASLNPAPVERIHHSTIDDCGVELFIKREDLLHPIISGNKWRKLKYILQHALSLETKHLISMGGPWSNHLHALAFVGQQLNIKTTGIIRGEEPENKSTTLQDMQSWGMELVYVSRSEFRELREFQAYDSQPAQKYAGYWIPEGGASPLALQGVAEILDELGDDSFDTIALACGTGTTLAGLASHQYQKQLLGFAALKGAAFLNDDVSKLVSTEHNNWSINLDYHFGGFAKTEQRLLDFMDEFEKQTAIQLDPIYTGKMMFGLFELIQEDKFAPDHKILAIHTGGLQGRAGFQL